MGNNKEKNGKLFIMGVPFLAKMRAEEWEWGTEICNREVHSFGHANSLS